MNFLTAIELIQLFHEGRGLSEMAYHFMRNESAIYQQLEKLNLFDIIKKRRNRTSFSENGCRCGYCKNVRICVHSPQNRAQLVDLICDRFQQEDENDDV